MELGDFYATKAISQIPRILSMLDRNEYSPTYGCFDRTFWLDKSIDFPSSILQLNTHNLAMAYAYPYPDNPFYQKEKIRKWTLAGIDYWTQIQHNDGSFDEFYPNERGWAGPTGFLLFSMLSTYDLLKEDMQKELKNRLFEASRKAANFLAKYDELGVLANHHAMALLPIYYAYKVLGDEKLLRAFNEKFSFFETLQSPEGWLLEYDGADLGYLSATVSFLGKLYKLSDDENLKSKILSIVEKAIEFSSYFVYPNKYYAGTIGSRQTLHFYPHGYELFCNDFPIARRIADVLLEGLAEGKLVSPEIMPERYLGYRVQEYLLTYLDYNPITIDETIRLPYERSPFIKHFEDAKMMAAKSDNYYLVANFAKGGVVKIFNARGDLIYNDCGIIGKLENGKIITSQWVDKDYTVQFTENGGVIEGNMNYAPYQYPTPLKMMALRTALLTLAWNTKLSYWLKGAIRDMFITNTKKAPVQFRREIIICGDKIEIGDKISKNASDKLLSINIGDEFSVRYVPQSLYFQQQELEVDGYQLEKELIDRLNASNWIELKRTITPVHEKIEFYTIDEFEV
jgi:hypothetical protein